MHLSWLLHFVHTDLFAESADVVLGASGLRAAEQLLQRNPEAGDLIQGTGGARKLRVPIGGRGKSYGARVVYYYLSRQSTIYLLLAYDKTEADDLSDAGKKVLMRTLRQIELESSERGGGITKEKVWLS